MENMKNTIGFYKGWKVEVTSVANDENHVLVRPLEDYNLEPDNHMIVGYQYYVHVSKIEPFAEMRYKVGDKVKSTIGTFVGYVVGIEDHTNRVICVSERIEKYNDKRVRYAYSLSELTTYEEDYELYQGKWYRVNGTYKLMATQHPGLNHCVMLITKNGEIKYEAIPKVTNRRELKLTFGIDTIKGV